MGAAWRRRGGGMEAALRLSAATLRRRYGDVEAAWGWRGCGVEAAWGLRGGGVGAALRRHVGGVGAAAER